MKRKAKFPLDKPIPVKVQRASDIVTSMTGNANFPTPVPPLTQVETAITELEAAYQIGLDGGLTAKAEQRSKNLLFNAKIRQLRDHVNEVAQGDEDIVFSSGFEASKIPAPVGKMPQVQKITSKGGDGDGSVTLRWKSVYGSKNYVVEQSTDGVSFKPVQYPTAARVTITGLVIGSFYIFRVAANGAKGLGSFSESYKVLAS